MAELTYDTEVECPDCKIGKIRPLDCCTNCGLSWEDLEAAAAFYDRLVKGA
jgi:hypothetical protein